MSAWQDNPLVGLGAALGILVALGVLVLTLRGCLAGPPAGPAMAYQCPACDTEWEQARTIGASCPQCDEPGYRTRQAQCRACKHAFEAWHVRQRGPGRFQYRLPAETTWIGTPPPVLACPNCRRKGSFEEGGLFFNPPAADSAGGKSPPVLE